METTICRVCIGVILGKMENKMETTICRGVYWGYIGILENKMETTICRVILGSYWDSGTEDGNYYMYGFILALSWGYKWKPLWYMGAILGEWKIKWKLL